MNTLWLRVGMSFELTNEELEMILGDSWNSDDMLDVLRKAFAEKRYRLEGDTYVPYPVIEEFNKNHGTDYKVYDRECCF